jgi:hypothetical protein
MKFFLTLYICSAITGDCIIPAQNLYTYPKEYNTHYECVRAGLTEAYEILYAEKFFTKESFIEYELYPKFGCDKVPIKGSDT